MAPSRANCAFRESFSHTLHIARFVLNWGGIKNFNKHVLFKQRSGNMNKRTATIGEDKKLFIKQEDHFLDFKSKLIAPARLQECFVAFANTDGGELYIGIEDEKCKVERVNGFSKIEDANDILETLLEQTIPAVENLDIEYIDFEDKGYVLHIFIPKSSKVHFTAQNKCFIRVNANKKEIKEKNTIIRICERGLSV